MSDFFKPASEMIEGFFSSDIVDQKSSSCSSVVRSGDALERFLACSVPYLKLNVFIVNFDRSAAKLNSDSEVMLLSKPLVGELKKQA